MTNTYTGGTIMEVWERCLARVKAMTPAEHQALSDERKRKRAEYHAELQRRLTEQLEGPTPVVPLLREAGVGFRHTVPLENKSLEKWPSVAVARAWVTLPLAQGQRPEHPFLTLCGPAETGKSQAAVVAAANWAARSVAPRATGQSRPIMALSTARLGSVPSWELEPVVLEASTCRFLLLEDLGKETLSKPVCSALFQILDERWKNQRRTVVSANVLPAELHRRLDWEGKEPAPGQEGACWRRLSAHWVATVSRAKGVLQVGGVERPFPAFDVPRGRAGAAAQDRRAP
jgi:DNA replication protein DnaC